ncbi:unnamed protein product [Miscanthus lutarioriparius]|uniref:Peptidase A1 domain-containing protein n=1 Tax=Miscanthus lutarioriparius TaxID=422564 RepID=A0A811PLR6_9POAL|nr:unnamed protein product [Miscanthus lutarioriparius]
MAPHSMHIVLPVLCLTVAVTAAHGLLIDFRADLNHPYAGSSLSTDDVIIHAARASRARAARINARLARVLGNLSAADVPVAPLSDQGHSLTLGIGTPPQPRTLIVDTGSDLIWTQCRLSRRTRTASRQREPLYEPRRSSSFAFLPCSDHLCQEGRFFDKNCTKNRCMYDELYGSAEADGVLASETFTFGVDSKLSLPLGFGCGALSAGSLVDASGLMGLSPGIMSLVSQLSVPRFSYCLTPFAERKTSPLLFGAMADLRKYKTTAQTTSIVRNPAMETAYYYVPLVGLSLGTKRLDVPATSLGIKPDGSGGTIVDSGSTMAYLAEKAFRAVKKAVLQTVRLPVVNGTDDEDYDYELCFALPSGVAMGAVKTPPLVLHFDGGAAMVLPRDNYFQEPRAGLMCLAVGSSPDDFGVSIIGNVQQQNMHVLFDVRNQKFSFAPTKCDEI